MDTIHVSKYFLENSQHFTPLQPRGLFFSCFFLEKSRSNICEHWMTQDCSGFFFWFYPQPQEMNTVKQIYKNSKFRETSIFSRANLILRLALHTLTTSVFGMDFFVFLMFLFQILQKGERKGFLVHTSHPHGVTNRWPTGVGIYVLQCVWRVAVYCSVVQRGAETCHKLLVCWYKYTGVAVCVTCCSVVQCGAVWSAAQRVAVICHESLGYWHGYTSVAVCVPCCIVVQCIAVCCSVLQCAAACAATCHKLLAYWHECCSVRDVLQCAAVRYSVMQWFVTNRWPVGMGIYMLQTAWRVAVCCSVFQHVAACCNDSWQMSGLLVWVCMCCSVRDMLQCVTACCIMLQWFVTNCWCHKSLSYWNGFTCVAVCVTGCCVLQRDAVICHQSLAYWYG